MHKKVLLDQGKMSKGISTLLGGQLASEVIHNNFYIPLMSVDPEEEGQKAPHSVEQVIFTMLSKNRNHGKPVMLVGLAGTGKTTTLDKLVVDWASGQHLQHFSYVFHFKVRELETIRGTLSLETLLLQRYSHLSPESMGLALQAPEALLFMFDGFEGCQHSLEPPTSPSLCSDPHQLASASCLVASLLHGTLLKGAAILLASRPTGMLNSLNGHRVELLVFQKPQRKAYVHRFFSDPGVASRMFQNMEKTFGFYDFCASPKFCWTVCSVFKFLMDAGERLPETLTQMFVIITVHLIQALSSDEAHDRDLVSALGRMACHCSLTQHATCTKEQLTSFGLQPFLSSQASVNAFLCVDGDLDSDDCVFSFHSQLCLEFLLAASFYLDKSKSENVEEMLKKHEGHVDFLQLYLSGLSNPTQRKPLESRLGEFSSDRIINFRRWVKSMSLKVLGGYYKEKHFDCFRLLHQSQDEGLVKEVVVPPARIGISYGGLGVQDCVALNYMVTCLGKIENLNLMNTKDLTGETVEILVPAMRLAHQITLRQSSLSAGALSHLASALSSGKTVDLNLSHTSMGDTGFKVLCTGLRDSVLHTLNVGACGLTEACGEDLVSVLTSGTSQLRVLTLSYNDLQDHGLRLLSRALLSPHCPLQNLQLLHCKLTGGSMEALSAVLCSGHSELRILDLTVNIIGDSGMEHLSKSLQHPQCKLQVLKCLDNELTGACCVALAKAFQSGKCCLRELDLSVNDLGQEGALLLCKALWNPGHPLETLSLVRCEMTPPVFQELGVLLRSGSPRLRSLSVGINKVGDQGAKHLWDALASQHCQLEYLDVEMMGLTDACVEDLCAAVKASGSLKTLILKNNNLTDDSVPALVTLMQDRPSMEELNVQYNNMSEDVFELMDKCSNIRY
ncbi:NACHT, LRR and PYD domains-containing protein 3 [Osmerus mordax]|uniref:NACHT, LRR and PYD domains-containing protein 3 n=1 Tax=Osmerus mordax TaxID=8014 RepID=UPI0035103925